MIKFHCKNCGQKIRVPEIHTGRKGKCPKCKNIVLVPKVEDTKPVASQTEPSASEIISRDAILDSHLYDIAQESKVVDHATVERSVSDKASEELGKLQGSLRKVEPEPVPERKLPWPIDILLYPINKSGLTMLVIFIGIPLFMEILVIVLSLFTSRFPPFYVFAVLFLVISLIINIIIRFYRYWYISECIRDSADGQIRASETVANTPGLWELFLIFLRMYVCIVVLSAPIYYYLLNSRGIERSFSSLFSFTLFFLWIVVTEVGKSGITFHVLLFFCCFLFPYNHIVRCHVRLLKRAEPRTDCTLVILYICPLLWLGTAALCIMVAGNINEEIYRNTVGFGTTRAYSLFTKNRQHLSNVGGGSSFGQVLLEI